MHNERAGILVEALPYIQKYQGKTIVVKYGGNAMINEELFRAVMQDIVLLSTVGVNVVLVHGGGPEINDLLRRTGKESRFHNGLRVTDEETMEIVQMVLCGKVNKNLVATINRTGGRAIGLCGLDGGLFLARKLDEELGLVGEVTECNPQIVLDAIKSGYLPVVSTIAQGTDADVSYNINADTAAAKLAVALHACKLMLLTDIRGLLRDAKDESTLLPEVHLSEIPGLVKDGVISGGMIPKIDCCVEAVRRGVSCANIVDGRTAHSILIELLSDEGAGTLIK